jgi:type II secretory pathway pseudopilin PulG
MAYPESALCTAINRITKRRCTRVRGFSLIELSIVLFLTTALAAFFLSAQRDGASPECKGKTEQQLQAIQGAMERYRSLHDSYPTPALLTLNVTDPLYGKQILATDAANYPNLNNVNGVLIGALPFVDLGLSPEFAVDCWNQKFVYRVTEHLTIAVGGYLDPTKLGRILVEKPPEDAFGGGGKGTGLRLKLADAAYAVVSFGADGVGALKQGDKDKINWCVSDPDTPYQNENCNIENNSIMVAPWNDGADAEMLYYDDLLIYEGKR